MSHEDSENLEYMMWESHPYTYRLITILESLKNDLTEPLIDGSLLNDPITASALVGKIELIDEILDTQDFLRGYFSPSGGTYE